MSNMQNVVLWKTILMDWSAPNGALPHPLLSFIIYIALVEIFFIYMLIVDDNFTFPQSFLGRKTVSILCGALAYIVLMGIECAIANSIVILIICILAGFVLINYCVHRLIDGLKKVIKHGMEKT